MIQMEYRHARTVSKTFPPLVEFDGPRQGGQADAVNLRKALGLCDQRFQQQTTEAHAAMFLCQQMWH